MTGEKPFCCLSLKYQFDKNEFYFESYGKTEDNHLCNRIWKNYKAKDGVQMGEVLLNPPLRVDEDSSTLIYNNVIEPFPLLIV